MKNENDVISDADLISLTGYKIPSKQCEILREAGIFFIIRRDGRPRTTWSHFNDPMKQRSAITVSKNIEPNFGALD
ncbi:DUF4224 domain-containing protein [Arsenophonus nasoniae]|uniref:DUF4224 domain-containing protein n=1 Tax=Arsenophonus nasoniae TaxID=638 RepID=A0AA95GNZ5_9GAMM|nr:DUF4224 domain-containing protein [Arsenophonus nasoniae]MDR5611509.1 DUF4224 domain-containing protein [Arsenophonus sp.]WGM00256.1 DUF4224 domain-containing protein [Arsenophonus nasoniae]